MALSLAVPKAKAARPTKVPRTTFHTDPTRLLAPSKISPRKPKINLSDVLHPDPTLPASLIRKPAPPPLMLAHPAIELTTQPKAATAPMKHRMREKNAHELYDAAEAKRVKFNRKYLNHCRRFGIPYPAVGLRETEHLDACHTCQQTWPLFLYEQHYVCKHPVEDVTRAWCDLPEFERVRLHRMLLQADRQWLKNMIKNRTASSFQLFVKDILDSQPDVKALKDIQRRSAKLSALWKNQTPEVIKSYEQRAQELKVERLNQLTHLPEFKKKQVARARREYRRVLRESHPPKPLNPYLLFQQAAWKEETQKPQHMTYMDFVKCMSQRWKTEVTEEQKQPYIDAASKHRSQYFVRRDAALSRLKAVKQQKREARKVILHTKQQRKVDPNQAQTDLDQGSDEDHTAPQLPPSDPVVGNVIFPRKKRQSEELSVVMGSDDDAAEEEETLEKEADHAEATSSSSDEDDSSQEEEEEPAKALEPESLRVGRDDETPLITLTFNPDFMLHYK